MFHRSSLLDRQSLSPRARKSSPRRFVTCAKPRRSFHIRLPFTFRLHLPLGQLGQIATMLLMNSLETVARAAHRFSGAGTTWEMDSEDRRKRLGFLGAGLSLLGFAVFLRLVFVERMDGDRWTRLASRQQQGLVEIHGARGPIVDREGRTLAASVETVSLGVHHRKIKDPREFAAQLAPITGLPVREIEQLASRERTFSWLKRGLEPEVEDRVRALGISGVTVFHEFRREYPQGVLAAPILGRVGRDDRGQSGIELRFDSDLAASTVNVPVRRDARGKLFTTIGASVSDTELRQEGGGVTLSLDSVIQGILEEELEIARRESGAQRTLGVMLDAETGEILAMAHLPNRFDPSQVEDISPEDLRSPLLQDCFEPGSTLKPLVAAAAVDAGVVNINERIDCENGSYRFGNRVIRDVHPAGILSLREVLIRSSNICMAKVGERLGEDRLYQSLKEFGIGETTEIELPGEGKGILRNVSTWADVDTATASFGQGVALTGLQLVRGYAVLANGGYLVKPTVLFQEQVPARHQVLRPETASDIRSALRGVTEDEHGTGKLAAIDGIPVYGKTGTAQKARKDGRGYDEKRYLSSFLGFTRKDESFINRSLVLGVFVDEPSTQVKYGGVLAAPVFRRVMSRTFAYLMRVEGIASQRAALTREEAQTHNPVDVS